MANTRVLQRSFAGGEVSPEMYGRIDDVKYQSGVAKCRNFIAKPQGPAENRPGFQFVRAVKYGTKKTRIIPFTFSTTDTVVIELGAGYFRFHSQGLTLMTDGYLHGPTETGYTPYEVANPYDEADLFDIHYVQSADVLTLVHPKYAPRELRRLGTTNWVLATLSLSAPISAPTGVTAVASGHTTAKYTYTYVVTAVAADGISESVKSSTADANGNLLETGGIVTISWSAVSGASRYNVYKLQSGLYGYIGGTTGLSVKDENVAPDMSKTPPIYDDPWVKGGAITSVPVTSGGSGYSIAELGRAFTSVSLQSPYTIYAPGTVAVTVSDPTGSGATFSATVGPGSWPYENFSQIKSVSVLTAGSNYTAPHFSVTVTYNGRTTTFGDIALDYTLSSATYQGPSIAITDTTGSGAVLKPVVSGGAITSISVVSGGQNYTSPSLTLTTNNGGSGAILGTPVVATAGDYPGAVSYYEQRRCFAGTTYRPQNLWMTKSGTESDMSYSLPVKDDDRIAVRVAAREANVIRHIVPLTQLLLMTSAAEWRVTSVNSDAITPTSISVKPQSYIGSNNVQPEIVNNTLVYCSARGGHVRELGYNWQANGFTTGDLSIRSAHLFDGYDIVDMCYSKAPQPILWFISTSGKLLGLSYVPEQQVGAWHQHDTDGQFKSCCVVAEGDEDVLYVVAARTVNGQYVQYVERLATRKFSTIVDAFFVDSGLTYSGVPADVISGLDHLEGKTVNILADGAVHPQRVVTDGSITLDVEASVVHIGLPIQADLQTLPLAMQIDGFGQGRMKNVNKAWLRVYRSSGVFVGPSPANLVEIKQRTTEMYGSPPSLKSEELQLMLTPSWSDGGQVYVRQNDPLPLTVAALTLEVAIGG